MTVFLAVACAVVRVGTGRRIGVIAEPLIEEVPVTFRRGLAHRPS